MNYGLIICPEAELDVYSLHINEIAITSGKLRQRQEQAFDLLLAPHQF